MKDIPTFEGKYAITEDGRVWSYRSERFLMPRNHIHGYSSTSLGRGNQFLIHRLVAEMFIPNPDKLPQVNHIDGNKKNNRVENLEWCTNSQNLYHSVKIGTYNHTRVRSKNYMKKLTLENVDEIVALSAQGYSHQSIADRFNVSRPLVNHYVKKANNITG